MVAAPTGHTVDSLFIPNRRPSYIIVVLPILRGPGPMRLVARNLMKICITGSRSGAERRVGEVEIEFRNENWPARIRPDEFQTADRWDER